MELWVKMDPGSIDQGLIYDVQYYQHQFRHGCQLKSQNFGKSLIFGVSVAIALKHSFLYEILILNYCKLFWLVQYICCTFHQYICLILADKYVRLGEALIIGLPVLPHPCACLLYRIKFTRAAC